MTIKMRYARDVFPEHQHLFCDELVLKFEPGWDGIVRDLLCRLAPFVPPTFKLTDIKQTYAQLLVYHNFGWGTLAVVDELTTAAAVVSRSTCEYCGKPGIFVIHRGGARVLCQPDLANWLQGRSS